MTGKHAQSKFFRLCAIITVFVMLIAGIAGCGSNSKPVTGSENTSVAETTVTQVESTQAAESEKPDGTEPKEDKLFTYDLSEHSGFIMIFFKMKHDEKPGDATFLRSPEGKTMLIDAGKKAAEPTVLSYLKEMGIERIDYLVASHLHGDHVGGFPRIMQELEIGKVIMPNVPVTETASVNFREAIKALNLDVQIMRRRDSYNFGEEILVEILNPMESEEPESENSPLLSSAGWINDRSLVMKFNYKNVTALFTGDVYKAKERELVQTFGSELDCDIFKSPHHGHNTSNSEEFLKTVSPKISVIPGDRIMSTTSYYTILENSGDTYIQGFDGNILIKTDGSDISVLTEYEHKRDVLNLRK